MTFILLAMAAFSLAAPIPEAPAPRCTHTDGLIDGPFVPNAAIATAIYRAVRPGIGEGPKPELPEVEVFDAGGHWEVMENRKRAPPSDPMEMTYGGGQLYLRIDKCTGAISDAAYNR
jgi:hypothetical protein